MSTPCRADRTGSSLNKLLAVVTILGIIAALVVPRLTLPRKAEESTLNSQSQVTNSSGVGH
jgi:hypothetical protein